MKKHAYLYAISLVSLSLFNTGCPDQTTEVDPVTNEPVPVYEVFTGSLYEQGGTSTDTRISVEAASVDSPEKSGYIRIGAKSTGYFHLFGADLNNFTMNGYTKKCTSYASSADSCYDWATVLNFGLSFKNNLLTGSSPTSYEPMVWELLRTVDLDGTETYAGSIASTTGPIPVTVKVLTDGTIEGRFTYESLTTIINGYLSQELVEARVPGAAAASALILAAIHRQSL